MIGSQAAEAFESVDLVGFGDVNLEEFIDALKDPEVVAKVPSTFEQLVGSTWQHFQDWRTVDHAVVPSDASGLHSLRNLL